MRKLILIAFIIGSTFVSAQETDVVWTQLHNAQVTGTTLERSSTVKATAISSSVLLGYGPSALNDGYIRYVADQDTKGRHLGFSSFPNMTRRRSELKYSFLFHQTGKVKILEEGVNQGVFNYVIGDEFKIAREQNDIVYYINNSEVRRVAVDAREDLFVEGMLTEDGSVLSDVKKNFSTLPFNVAIDVNSTANSIDLTVSGANAPYTYLWMDGQTTEDISAVPNGVHTVEISDAYNNKVIRKISLNAQVSWTNFDRSLETNEELIKDPATNGNWGGAIGPNPLWVNEDGWMEYTLTNSGTRRAFGFSTQATVRKPQDIKFGFFILDKYRFKIIEDGVYLANQSYLENDVFKVEKRGGFILYYKNDQLLYSHSLVANEEYNFAGSVKTGATLRKVRCHKRITPYPVNIQGVVTHSDASADNGSIDLTIDLGTHSADFYRWVKLENGIPSVVEQGSDFNEIDVDNLSDGLYLFDVRESGDVVDYRYFLVGKEGVITNVAFWFNNNISRGVYGEDALLRYDKASANGDLPGGTATGNTALTSSSYDAKAVIKHLVDFDPNLVFLKADQTLRPKGGHFQNNFSYNSGYLSRITEDWQEDYVTWNDAPTVSTTNQIVIPGTNTIGYEMRFDTIDVLPFVYEWQSNPGTNFGYELALQSYNQPVLASLDYASSEFQGMNLIVSFTVPGGPIKIEETVNHATAGNADGSISVSVTGGEFNYTNYQWLKYDMGTVSVLAAGTDIANADISNLSDGLYLINVTDSNGKVGYKYVLVGEEGKTTTVQFHDLASNGARSFAYNEDAQLKYFYQTGNGDVTGGDVGRISASDSKNNAWYHRSLLRFEVDYPQELKFLDANLHLTGEALGHFRDDLTVTNAGTISKITSAWDEQTVTWNTRPTTTTVDQIAIAETATAGFTVRDDDFDFLSLVQYWQANPEEDFGVEFALNTYGSGKTTRLEYYGPDNGGSGIRPVYELTFRLPGEVETEFDLSKGTGSLTINAPSGDLPYTYFISDEPLPELNDVWQIVKDSIPVDSSTFFGGSVNSQNFAFENLESNSYYIATYDNRGVKILDEEIFLKPSLRLADTTGIILDGDTISVDTTFFPSAVAVHWSNLPREEISGFEIEITEMLDDVIAGIHSINEPRIIYDNDFQFAIEVRSNGKVNFLNYGEIRYFATGVTGDKFRLIKDVNSVKYYKNGLLLYEDVIPAYDRGDYKSEVKLKGPFSEIIFKPIFYKGPRANITYTNPICGEDLGSVVINPSSFHGLNLDYYSLLDESGNVVSQSVVVPTVFPVTVSGLSPGTYTLNTGFSNGQISISGVQQTITIGYPIQWTNLTNLNLLTNTTNSIQLATTTGTGSANSINAVDENDNFWVQTEIVDVSGGVSFNNFDIKNNGSSVAKINMIKFGLTKFVWIQSQGSSVPLNTNLASSYGQFGPFVAYNFNNKPFRIEHDGTNIFVEHNDNLITTSLMPSTGSSDLLRVFSAHGLSGLRVQNTISSFCYPVSSHYVKLRRIIDGGYYLANEGILKVEYDEEYNDDEFEFNIYDDTYDPDNPVPTNLLIPSISYGDNRIVFDFSCPGPSCLQSGIYILEVINDKDEKLYLRFKI